MKFIPYHSFSIETKKTKKELIRTSRINIQAPHNEWEQSKRSEFQGKITERGFIINRTFFKAVTMPIIEAKFRPTPSNTIIEVSMRPHIMIVILAVSPFLASLVFLLFGKYEPVELSTLTPVFILMCFQPLLLNYAFWYRGRKDIVKIHNMFDDKAVKDEVNDDVIEK